jgi:hypothetical protein
MFSPPLESQGAPIRGRGAQIARVYIYISITRKTYA